MNEDSTGDLTADAEITSVDAILRNMTEMNQRVALLRGSFLNVVIGIDEQLNSTLADLVCGDATGQYLFLSAFLPEAEITFRNKTRALEKTLKALFFPISVKQILKDLDSIREFRNALAHNPVDMPWLADPKAPPGGIRLRRWKSGQAHSEEITEDAMRDRIALAQKCATELFELQKEIGRMRAMLPKRPIPRLLGEDPPPGADG